MKLWKTEAKIYKEKKFSFEKDSFEQTQVDVIAENDNYVCLDDFRFTTIQKSGKGTAYDVIGTKRIRIEDGSGLFGSAFTKGIFYTLYSFEKKRPSTVRKEIEEAIKKKYGWIADVNLDIIK